MSLSNICIVEGFDIVGKSTFINYQLPEYELYYYNHDISDETIGRSNACILGMNVIDFLSQVKPKEKIIINRGIFSSIVYEKLYNNNILPDIVIDYYKNSEYFHNNIDIIYLMHDSRASAEILYQNSLHRPLNPNELNQEYDRFESFNDYWSIYMRAHNLFMNAFEDLKIKPYIVRTNSLSEEGK